MPLETATHISELVASNPASSDGLNQADDHLRLIKQVLLTDIGDAFHGQSLSVIDGSASVPSIGFQSDNTAGFYKKSTGETAVVGSLTGQGPVPIGTVIMHAAAAAPAGYLTCDGQAVSRTAFPGLFAAIGTLWGAGDGSTTFNVPGLQSRFPRHREDAGAAGAVGTKQADQNKTHTHTGSGTTGNESANHTHSFSGTTGTEGSVHTHSYFEFNGGAGNAGGAPGGFRDPSPTQTGGESSVHTHNFSGTTGIESAPHTHSFSFTTTNGSADGTEVRPLSATLLFCIRAS
jgi:microcystin-dependent protein